MIHVSPLPSAINIAGHRFGKLTAIRLSGTSKQRSLCWICVCDCGRQVEAAANQLRALRMAHCGCLGRGRHGMNRTKVHRAWGAMKARCYNPNHNEFHNYGQRGIEICDQWRTDFRAFYEHIGDPPTPQHSVDRIDPNGNYEPGNVKWSTPKEQNRNRRDNRLLTYKGETKCLNEWAEVLGIKPITLYFRIRNGWSVERAFEEPVQVHTKRP